MALLGLEGFSLLFGFFAWLVVMIVALINIIRGRRHDKEESE